MPASTKQTSTLKTARRKGLGWRPDLPDHRDKLYADIAQPPKQLPSRVDLRASCSPVENQGSIQSCTANALVGALEFLEEADKLRFTDLSRLFIYFNERALEDAVQTDHGAALRDGIKTLAKQGVCAEAKWPYEKAKLFLKPFAACYREAAQHKITSYHRLTSLTEMRQCLAEGFPFVFGFTVYTAFHSDQVRKTGVLKMPKPGEGVEGGHAVLGVGYDDGQKALLVRNSWGPAWGQNGYFTMPYAYLENQNLSDDFWTIRRGEQL